MNKLYQTDLEKHACEVFSNSLNEINNNAYKDKYLLANPLLSRNPYINNLLNRIYKREKAKGKVLLSTVAKKVILYYIKSFALVFLWLAKKTAFHLSGYKNNRYAKSIKNQTELVVVDIFSVVDNIKKNNFRDRNYLRGLDTILERNNVPYIYAPIFYGSHNPLKFYSIFKKIQTTNIDYITDFELFQITEIIKIIKFILVYPWKVLNLCKSLNNSGNINKLIQEELVNTLATTWHNYARRLMGEKLSNLHPKIKVLSWDESQVIHKNFYRGLRDGSGVVNIIGCQFFLRHSIWVNLGVSEQEIKLGLVPNKILTNGKENILCSGLKYEPGVSLRYLDLFDQPINSNGDDLKSLVLLSYFEKESYNLLRLVSKSTCTEDFLIKPHPALNLCFNESLNKK
ncbi:MAG: hypothetical protein QS721_08685 [Candidatus Endonucleobacter sp. (ex Gigantidas childressi)]|nr:hypothetical protein [Candidatus Endonucleobacter sp. (ex Gigantidas childressi)]